MDNNEERVSIENSDFEMYISYMERANIIERMIEHNCVLSDGVLRAILDMPKGDGEI